MRVRFLPFVWVGLFRARALFFFRIALPGFIGLRVGALIGALARVVSRLFFAHVVLLHKPKPRLPKSSYKEGFARRAYSAAVWRRDDMRIRNPLKLAAFTNMRTFTFNITDLTSFESPSLAISLNDEKVREFTVMVARDFILAMPDLDLKGLCVALYDEAGDPISIVPLDSVQ